MGKRGRDAAPTVLLTPSGKPPAPKRKANRHTPAAMKAPPRGLQAGRGRAAAAKPVAGRAGRRVVDSDDDDGEEVEDQEMDFMSEDEDEVEEGGCEVSGRA